MLCKLPDGGNEEQDGIGQNDEICLVSTWLQRNRHDCDAATLRGTLSYVSASLTEFQLFPDAEVPEDVAKDLVGGDVAGDGGEVVDALADVLTQEIARYAVLEALADAPDALLSLDK